MLLSVELIGWSSVLCVEESVFRKQGKVYSTCEQSSPEKCSIAYEVPPRSCALAGIAAS